MRSVISFPPSWVGSNVFESALQSGVAPHDPTAFEVSFDIPVDCKINVEAGIRLLSLANQLSYSGKRVTLNFVQGECGRMGYLNPMGFFDHLAKEVVVVPSRPLFSAAKNHHQYNSQLVEIARVAKEKVDQDLPNRLSGAVKSACCARSDVDRLEHAAWFIFSELINNIEEHSSTVLDGYAALQVYLRGNKLLVSVSDSGVGIMETLRPALKTDHPKLAALSDADLLVEVFKTGISRLGDGRGLGLQGCALKASRFRATLDVRLPKGRVTLTPGVEGYTRATWSRDLPLLWGTHISFGLSLT